MKNNHQILAGKTRFQNEFISNLNNFFLNQTSSDKLFSVNKAYASVFIVVAWLCTSLVLTHYSKFLTGLIPPTNFYREFLICGGQIVFQGIVISFINKSKRLQYLTGMMAISLAGAVILLPPFVFSSVFKITETYFYIGWFAVVVGLMFLTHLRFCKYIQLPLLLSISWVIYRFIVLAIIL